MKTFKNTLFSKILVFMCAGFIGLAPISSMISTMTVDTYADENITTASINGVVDKVESGLTDTQKALERIANVGFIVAIGAVVLVLIFEHDPKGLRTKLIAIGIVMLAIFIFRLAVNGTLLNIVNELAGGATGAETGT